jgi:chorismate mutase-like protein
MDKAAPDPLTAIRTRIDAIDAEMHRLLIERSGVIRELIEIKGTSRPASAFRPDREADMMRRLVMRHEGELPLATVEHIWREIITTFTAMQAPFGIAAGPAADALALRDAIRFYFGFSIAVMDCATSAEAVARVKSSARDIAIVPAESGGRWWDGLSGASAPKVFARLPFIEIPSRPADFPAYVIGPPLEGKAAPDVQVFAISAGERTEAAIVSHGGRVAARAGDEFLVELPIAASLDDVAREAGGPLKPKLLGGFYQPIRFLAERVA